MGAQGTSAAVHGDMARAVCVDTAAMAWEASPHAGVWRKRLHRVGPPEAGQVTSVVRYDPGARFHEHGHPEGEEILVLEGVFSDQQGDWPAGSWLLNPEGFRHAPWSDEGCVILVKLRQYPGADHVAVDTSALSWQASDELGVERKPLHEDPVVGEATRLERWAPGASPAPRAYPRGAELYLISGSLADARGRHGAGAWLRLAPDARHAATSAEGCVVYLKAGAVARLRGAVKGGA